MTENERKTVSQCVSSDYCKGWNDAVDAMPKWISVKDALPAYGERVLITEGTCVFEAYRSISNKWVRSGIGWAEDVTYWMPLPEPPKGDKG